MRPSGKNDSKKIKLPFNEVHLWLVTISSMKAKIETLWCLLSDDEVDRAKRFHFENDRKRFVVARGMLRTLLSHYCWCGPDEHRFRYSQYGKPYLVDNDRPRFSVSYSNDKILYGFTQSREIGVDIEHIKPFENACEIVEKFFSDDEKIQFRGLPNHMKNRAFYNCWTRKESYVKALGKGLSLPLDEFSVSLIPNEPACLLQTKHNILEKNRWTLKELEVGEKYVAAVTAEGSNLKIQWLMNGEDIKITKAASCLEPEERGTKTGPSS